MQTLKTGAIIVLLMTIVFSAYTSLTSPPESLPSEVAEALIFNEDGNFAIDDGLPPSLANMEFGNDPSELAIDAGQAVASGQTVANQSLANQSLSGQSSSGQPTPGNGFDNDALYGIVDAGSAANTDPAASMPAATNLGNPNAADIAGNSQNTTNQNTGINVGFSDAAGFANANPSSVSASGVPANGYPNTGTTFTMPDAASVGLDSQTPVQLASARTNQFATDNIQNASVESPTATPATADAASIDIGLRNAIATADRQFEEGRLRDALATLSLFYTTPDLAASQRDEMLSRLDFLAGRVIYSPRHLLETPYRVRDGQTLISIADEFQVPWQLLASINQVRNPSSVVPGTELKVMRGPMRAEISLDAGELTLFLGELYAGRFSVVAGQHPGLVPGVYTVGDKLPGKPFQTVDGQTLAAGQPGNPFGNAYIDLGNGLCLHGSSPSGPVDASRPGACLALASADANDLMGILSAGSQIELKR